MSLKAQFFCLIEEKRDTIKKLQSEIELLLFAYKSLPSEEPEEK